MKIVLVGLLWALVANPTLVCGYTDVITERELLKDVRFDLTDAMRRKLASVASRWMLENAADEHALDGTHVVSLRRSLAVGDFDEFNELFQNASIDLPDFEVSDRVIGIRLKLGLKELYCEDISVGDILLTPNKESNQRLTFKVDLVDIALNCYGRFNYDYGFLDGNGRLEANINKSQASTVLAFRSSNFNLQPPSDSTVDSCDAEINIYNMEFRGGIVSRILDAAQRLVGNRIEGEIAGVACDELSSLGATFIDDILAMVKEEIDFYLEPLPDSLADPLLAENELQVPEGVTLLDFQDTGNTIGAWFNSALQEVDSLLANTVEDLEGPIAEGRDLGVNVFLRDVLLDADRALTIRVADLPGDGFDGVLFNSHDKLTETVITLDAAKIFGLDTFRRFDPLVDIGKHTLRNEFRWDYLTFELDVTVDIKPSTKPDSILVNPDPVNIVEVIKISFGVDNLDVVIAVMTAIDQGKLGNLHLGSLLRSENMFSCLVSVLQDLEISGLRVSAANIRDPVLEGFISPGVDRIVTSAVEAAFLMYEPTLKRAMPTIFQRFVRDILNKEVIESVLFSPDTLRCPWAQGDSSLMDFRDLFLDPELAESFGTAGGQPYGDVGYLLFDILQERFQTTENDGVLSINSMIVQPLTRTQSGVDGELRFPSSLVALENDKVSSSIFGSLVDRFELRLSDLRIQHLDSIVAPMSIVEPTFRGHVVENLLNANPGSDRSLDITATLLIALEGNSSLSMRNELDISISVDSVELFTDVYAAMTSKSFLELPVRHVLDLDCWLAMIPETQLDAEGLSDSNVERGLGLRSFLTKLSGVSLGAVCLECLSPGTAILPELLGILEESRATYTLGYRLESLLQSLLKSDTVQAFLDGKLADAHAFCPVSPKFNASAVRSGNSFSGFPRLSANAVDTMLYAAVLASEVGFVVFVENHLRVPRQATSLLSGQESLQVPKETRLLDWSDLEGSLGSLADTAMKEAKRFLGGADDDGDLRINDIIGDLLGVSGIIDLDFDDLSFQVDDFVVAVKTARLKGLDSFTRFKVLEPVAPQTLQNFVQLDTMRVEVDLRVGFLSANDAPRDITLSFEVNDVSAEIAVLAAFDLDKLGAIELGSLLRVRNIVPCILSAAHDISIPQMKVSVGSFREPTIEGLMPDTGSAASAATAALVERFQSEIEDAIPIIFDSTVRQVANVLLEVAGRDSTCPEPALTTSDKYVDFRTMFLPSDSPDTVERPFGDLPAFLKDWLDTELLSEDPSTGLSKINDILVRSMTKDQSGEEGVLRLTGDLLSAEFDGLDAVGLDVIEFSAADARVENVDTLRGPIDLLAPNTTNGLLLDNRASLGGEPDPLRLGLTAVLAFVGDPALSSRNELDFMLELENMDLFAVLLARMGVRQLMTFPLERIANVHCWLSLFATPELDAKGFRLANAPRGLALEAMTLAVSSVRFTVGCASSTSCSSVGLATLPEVLATIEASGVMDVLEDRLLFFALELLEGSFIQTYLDRLLVDSSHRCPEHPNSLAGGTNVTYPSPAFPSLSRDSLEVLVFAGVLGLDVAAVMVAESHSAYPNEVADPLSAQKAFLISEDRFLDFTALDASVGAWADSLIKEVKGYVSEEVEDSGGPSGTTDLGINTLARSLVLDDNGVLVMDLDSAQFSVGGLEFALRGLRVHGLDTFEKFDILDFIGPQTLQNGMSLKRLRVELDLAIELNAEEMSFSISFEVTDVDVSLSLFIAVDQDTLGDLELGQLLDMKQILPCLLSSAREVAVTELDVTFGSIESFGVEGFQGADTGPAMETLSQLILEQYGKVLESSIQPLFGVTIKTMLNNFLGSYLEQESNIACPKSEFGVTGLEYVDFRELLLSEPVALARGASGQSQYGNLVRTLFELAREQFLEIDPATGLSGVNSLLVSPLTKAQSRVPGSLLFPGNLFDQGTRINVGGLDARIRLRAYDAYLKNIDTVGAPLSLLDTVEEQPNQLNNTATLGVDRPVRVGLRFFFSLTDDDNEELRNDLEINLDMNSISIVLTALVRLAEDSFFGFPLRDIVNGQCWLAMMPAPPLDARGLRLESTEPSLSLVHLVASVAKLNLNITCISCTSPGMAELATLLSTPEASDGATDVANDLFGYATKLLGGEYLQVMFDRMLNDAKLKCPHSSEYKDSPAPVTYQPFETSESTDASIQFLIALAIGMGCLIVVVAAVVIIVGLVVRRRHRKWLRSLSSERVFLLWQVQRASQAKEAKLNETTKSLFRSPQIPLWIRVFIPFVILGNIGLFLSGHLSLGATVNIEATVAGQTFTVANFFEFSMAFSITEIWNAGGKELAIFILLFSGVWPYTKQLATLALWFLPPRMVSVSKRGSIFLWLDALAKWSMVDIFVLVIVLAAFRVSVQSPDVEFLPEDFYSLDLLVVPMWGLYANMIAQLVSQISSHFIVHYHRSVVADASKRHDQELLMVRSTDTFILDDDEEEIAPPASDKKENLATRAFTRPHRGESDKLVTRRGVDLMLVVSALITSALVVLGCTLPAFSQEVLGIIGIMVESGQEFEQATTQHSIFSIIAMFFEQARFTGRTADYIGLGSLGAILVLTVLIVPIVQAGVLLYQWFRPLTKKARGRLSVLVEILQAWQYAEVFLLAMIIAGWQIGPVSDFMVNDYCGGLTETFSQLVFYGILEESDAQCFRVESSLEVGAYLLGAAAILLALLNSFVMKAVAQFFRDTQDEDEPPVILDDSADESADYATAVDKIQPVPVLFTDTFRWFLHRQDKSSSFHATQVLDDDSMLGIDHPFPHRATAVPTRETLNLKSGHDLMADTMVDDGEDQPSMKPLILKDTELVKKDSASSYDAGQVPWMLKMSSESMSSSSGPSDNGSNG